VLPVDPAVLAVLPVDPAVPAALAVLVVLPAVLVALAVVREKLWSMPMSGGQRAARSCLPI
jgi:hypothetical protein